MNLHITKSKNSESFYICKSYVKANGSTSSMIVRKLGTLEQLLVEHGPTRDDVLAWAKNEVKIETEKYKREKEAQTVLIPFHADRQLDYDKQVFYRGGYLFLQSISFPLPGGFGTFTLEKRAPPGAQDKNAAPLPYPADGAAFCLL